MFTENKDGQIVLKDTVVEAFVEGRKSKGQIATVTFLKKKDGTERKINGVFAPVSHIVGSERGQLQSEAMKARGQIPIYSIAEKGWKSFYKDRVVEIS